MKTRIAIIVASVLLFSLFSIQALYSNVTIEPYGFGAEIEQEEVAEIELVLTNDSEDETIFKISARLVEDEDEGLRNVENLDHNAVDDLNAGIRRSSDTSENDMNRHGPSRDDPGDVLRQVGAPYNMTHGLAWDADRSWMWGFDFNRDCMWALDPEEEEIMEEFGIPHNKAGLFYLEGVLYVGGWGVNTIYRYDVEGNALEALMPPVNPGMAWIASDGEHVFTNNFQNMVILVFTLGDELEHIATMDFSQATGGNAAWSIEWVNEHPDGPLWLAGLNRIYQCSVDDEWNCGAVQDFGSIQGTNSAIGHDGENLWRGVFNSPFNVIDDGVAEMRLLQFEPREGILEGEGSQDLIARIVSEEVEEGIYHYNVTITLTKIIDEEETESLLEFSAVISVGTPTADIFGDVVSEADGAEIEGALIEMDPFVVNRYSDEEGVFEFRDFPFGEYEFTITAQDFLPGVYNLEIDEAAEFALDVSLLHAECTPDVEVIEEFVAPDEQVSVGFTVHNGGTGTLTYTIDRRLLGDANADPWVLRNSLYVGEEVDDTYIMGAIFDGENFYVSGSHDNSPVIYIFDREGNFQDSFDQPGDDRRGLRDLAWDGNLIWGADSDNIYGFNRTGEVQYTFDAPYSPTSNITWDPIHQWLWVSTTTTNILALDLNGDQQAVVDRQGLRVYGLGFYPDDPDGYNLYIFAKEPDTDRPYIHKANTDEDDVMFVEYLDTEIGGSPGGVFITNEYDIYSYVMVAAINAPGNIGGDRIDIWQVDARKSWMQIDPAEGVIDAGERGQFTLTLDATDLPPEQFVGELVFLHDGVGSETHVPVTLNVVEGPVEAELTLEFEQGWNMVSVYLQPEPDDVVALMQPLVDEDLLLLMKNGSGNFYSPADNFNNIPGWFVYEGYLMKVTEPCELTLAGETVVQDEPIDLLQGWQMISCYLRDSVDAIVALSGIVDNLVIAKDGWGNFYKPDWEFSNMGDMIWGRGYMVKMTEDTQLIYRLFLEDDELDHVQQRSVYASPGRLGVHPVTGANMSLMAIAGSGFEASAGETEIGVYASGELVGSGILQGGRCGIAVWGDDPSTPAVDGALAGEALEIRVLDANGLRAAECVTLAGSPSYKTDSFWAVELTGAEVVPAEFGIAAVYPNPFNSRTQVSYGLSVAGHVELSLYDLEGRLVQVLASGEKPAGMHTFAIDGASLSSGVYIVQLRSQGEVSRWKVAMMK